MAEDYTLYLTTKNGRGDNFNYRARDLVCPNNDLASPYLFPRGPSADMILRRVDLNRDFNSKWRVLWKEDK
jgi:hypothetical protein